MIGPAASNIFPQLWFPLLPSINAVTAMPATAGSMARQDRRDTRSGDPRRHGVELHSDPTDEGIVLERRDEGWRRSP